MAKNDVGKAQLNIDFISGFFLFITIVMFIAFSVSQKFPAYIAQANDNNLKLGAWEASENFMQASEKNSALKTDIIKTISSCVNYDYSNMASRNNYSYVKQLMALEDSNSVHITIDAMFFGMMNSGSTSQKSGTVYIYGKQYPIDARNVSNYFTEARSSGAWSSQSVEVSLPPSEYFDVAAIDYYGDYVLLKKRLVDCGPKPPLYLTNAVIKRYSTYNGSLAVIGITYW